MAGQRDHYEVLGISRDASEDDIKSAHRRLAREHHPDLNKSEDAAERFAATAQQADCLQAQFRRSNLDNHKLVHENTQLKIGQLALQAKRRNNAL